MLKIKNKKLDNWDGVLVLGNNNQANNPMVAVWSKGANLNDDEFRPHHWPNWEAQSQGADQSFIRHYPKVPNEVQVCTKSELKSAMGIEHLNSSQQGFKFYWNTNIGDVLYITYDTNTPSWQEAIRVGFIDRKTRINVPQNVVAANTSYNNANNDTLLKFSDEIGEIFNKYNIVPRTNLQSYTESSKKKHDKTYHRDWDDLYIGDKQ